MVMEEGGRQQQTEDIRKVSLSYIMTVLFSTKFYPIHHLYTTEYMLCKQVNKPTATMKVTL